MKAGRREAQEESLCDRQMISTRGRPARERPPVLEELCEPADDGVAQMGSSLAPSSLLCMDPAL